MLILLNANANANNKAYAYANREANVTTFNADFIGCQSHSANTNANVNPNAKVNSNAIVIANAINANEAKAEVTANSNVDS